jgi:hypothetical protein
MALYSGDVANTWAPEWVELSRGDFLVFWATKWLDGQVNKEVATTDCSD